ncbi:MAG: PGF-CTERM-anchored ABC transporter substrate-binding protein [Haloferacaceae archaeon]
MSRHVAVALSSVLVLAAVLGAAAPAAASHGGSTAADCAFPVTRTDATGTEVTIAAPPERIVTLSPSAAQTLWEVGARDRVVATTQFATYLEGAEDLARVPAASGSVNPERVIGLDPGLVFAPGTISAGTVETLRDAGVTVFALETPATVEGVAQKTTLVGRLVGECAGAAATNRWMRQNVAAVERAVADEPRPRALYLLGGGFTAGNGTFVHDVMRTAGLSNVAAAAGLSGYARISPEVVRERNPEWLIRTPGVSVPDDPVYRETTAVRENNTVVVNANYLTQPAPRSIVRATRAIATAVHPEAADEAAYVPRDAVRETATATGTDTERRTATARPTATPAPTGDEGAGFGVVAAVAAVLGAAFLARRRR